MADSDDERRGRDERHGDGDAELAAAMSALFATALSDEPPSAVTPLGVLRRARLERAGQRQVRIGRVRRWGGALVAAAAVAAAVLVLGPALFDRSSPSATESAGTVPAAAGAGACAAGGPPRSCADAGPVPAGPSASSAAAGSSGGSGAGAGGAESGGSGQDASGGSAGSSAAAPAAPAGPGRAGDGTGGPAGTPSSSAASSASGSSAPGSRLPQTGRDTVDGGAVPTAEQDCALPALPPANRDAAVSALPANAVTGIGPVGRCRAGDVRGTAFQLSWPDSSLTVVLARTADCRSCPQDDSGRPAVTTSAGSVTASAGREGVTVRVTADPAAAAHLTHQQLAAVVTAVLDSNR